MIGSLFWDGLYLDSSNFQITTANLIMTKVERAMLAFKGTNLWLYEWTLSCSGDLLKSQAKQQRTHLKIRDDDYAWPPYALLIGRELSFTKRFLREKRCREVMMEHAALTEFMEIIDRLSLFGNRKKNLGPTFADGGLVSCAWKLEQGRSRFGWENLRVKWSDVSLLEP